MDICSEKHDEICYEQKGSCPICAIIEDLEGDIANLQESVDALEKERDTN